MHKQGPSASLQLRQKGEWGEKGALWWSPYVSVSGHSMSRKGGKKRVMLAEYGVTSLLPSRFFL